jgi:hypothetical protein
VARGSDWHAGPIVVAIAMTLRLSDIRADPASAFSSLLKPNDKDGLFGTLMHVCVGTLFTALPIAWACFLALT